MCNKKLVEEAYKLYFSGKTEELSDLLSNERENEDIDIQFLLFYCLFDDDNSSELTDEEADRRCVEHLIKFSDLNVPHACYCLAFDYTNGDAIARDHTKAAELFKRAADLGHHGALITHSYNLFRGSLGVGVNKKEALICIQKAIDLGVEGAEDVYIEFINA